jgi:hypothetical protein
MRCLALWIAFACLCLSTGTMLVAYYFRSPKKRVGLLTLGL